MKIAQRFNAGLYATGEQVPKGRLKEGADSYTFSRPFGTRFLGTRFPALKLRATLAMYLRDNRSPYDREFPKRLPLSNDWVSSSLTCRNTPGWVRCHI